MKKALAFLLLLCILLVAFLLIYFFPPIDNFTEIIQKGKQHSVSEPSSVTISSPLSSPHIYSNTTVMLNIGASEFSQTIHSCFYSLDNGSTKICFPLRNGYPHMYYGSTPLIDLKNGFHTVIVCVEDSQGNLMLTSRNFTINSEFKQPKISIISPQNTTYMTSEVPLTVISGEKWLSYHSVLDKKTRSNLNTHENATISGLSNGMHNITVYASFENDYTDFQTVYFFVNSQNPANTKPTIVPFSPIQQNMPSPIPSTESAYYFIVENSSIQGFIVRNIGWITIAWIIAFVSVIAIIFQEYSLKHLTNKQSF
jgi:hypothetical protein